MHQLIKKVFELEQIILVIAPNHHPESLEVVLFYRMSRDTEKYTRQQIATTY